MLLPRIATALLLLRPALAVWADEAWTVDYHYALLGQPREDTTFFHQPNPSSRASLLYTLSEKGLLGAVNPKDGAIVWRQRLHPDVTPANVSFARAGEGQEIIVSGIADRVTAWSAGDGKQVWELQEDGLVEDVEILEVIDAQDTPSVKDAVVLTSGSTPAVQRVDGATGAVKWEHKLDITDAPYQLSMSTTEVFAILLHKTLLGYHKIRVVTLDPVSGQKTDEYTLNSENELSTAQSLISVGANSASPVIAWTDATNSVLKVNIIGTSTIASFNIDKHEGQSVERVRLHAPYRTNSLAHFLVHYETATAHWADVFHIDLKKSKIDKSYSLPKLSGRGAFSTSTSEANVYFTRVTHDELITVSSTSHGVLGRWPVKAGTVFNPGAGPVHAVSEVSIKGDTVSAIRTAVLTSTGSWVLLRDGAGQWQRPEQLASTVAATFSISAVVEAFAQDLQVEASSNPITAYFHRVQRHIADLQQLPSVLSSLPGRFLQGFLGTTADSITGKNNFGFNQIIVCATHDGRLVAIDASDPNKILWGGRANGYRAGEPWNPELTTNNGLVTLRNAGVSGTQLFNASTGEQSVSILPVSDEELAAAQAVRYQIRDGTLQATVGKREAWSFAPSDGERILSLVPRPANDPVASIGKVLGDRRVLYKYLSPNVAVLITAKESHGVATIYVLDTVSGAIVHSNTHAGVDLSAPVPAVVSENWFAYSFTGAPSEDSPKGHQLVVGEMFESLVPNDRGPLSASTNFSSLKDTPEPFVLAQTYQIAEPISRLAVTRTRQGITSRQLLAVLPDSNGIVGIPYQALDPRRPVGRDATNDEKMEGLSQYSPVIDFDPKWYLNHQREVIGIREVLTSPALIESTSLVFAYGLDVFGTRLSPSFSFDILGKDFNKFQMLATVIGLAAGTLVVAPLVARKQVNQRWQFA